jgi:microcystin degradation protein MlrC
MKRIAIASIFTESNHLSGGWTEYAAFVHTERLRGDEVFRQPQGAVRGMLDYCQAHDCVPVPLLVASAFPGPPLSLACYNALKQELLDRLQAAGAVDGVLLALHGAAAVEEIGHLDTDLIHAVRQIARPPVPVVVSLDMHGHVTSQMVREATAIVAWQTYPHRDTVETGMRAARIVIGAINGTLNPVMAAARVPLLASGIHGSTEGSGPMADLMRHAGQLQQRRPVVDISLFQVHPYLDFSELGAVALVVTDGDADVAERTATALAAEFWRNRNRFTVETYTPEEAIAQGLRIDGGPVILVETADCIGGGASGDSVATFRALRRAQPEGISVAPVVDPEAAELCHRHGEGARVSLHVGHRIDPRWGEPLALEGEIVRLGDGCFTYNGGIWQGKEASMGPSALLRCGSVYLLVASRPTYDWADEQFRSAGLGAAECKFVVAKNPMNFRLAYSSIAKACFILDTPGPTPATVRHIRYDRMQHPFFPQDELGENVTPQRLG